MQNMLFFFCGKGVEKRVLESESRSKRGRVRRRDYFFLRIKFEFFYQKVLYVLFISRGGELF